MLLNCLVELGKIIALAICTCKLNEIESPLGPKMKYLWFSVSDQPCKIVATEYFIDENNFNIL